jgi:uncharacterized membrane protein
MKSEIVETKEVDAASEDERVAQIVAQGPRGALALAATAVAIVVAIWVAFYLLAFLPRGPIG